MEKVKKMNNHNNARPLEENNRNAFCRKPSKTNFLEKSFIEFYTCKAVLLCENVMIVRQDDSIFCHVTVLHLQLRIDKYVFPDFKSFARK